MQPLRQTRAASREIQYYPAFCCVHASISEVYRSVHEVTKPACRYRVGKCWCNGVYSTGEGEAIDINIVHTYVMMAGLDGTFERQGRDTIAVEEHQTSIGGHSSLAHRRKSYTIAITLHVH